jgi:hypothetical protein
MHLVEIFGWEYAENGISDRLEESAAERCTLGLGVRNLTEGSILIGGIHPSTFQSDTSGRTCGFGGSKYGGFSGQTTYGAVHLVTTSM